MHQAEIYDTTLRDGAQQEGISLSVEDKIAIALKLDELGVHFIEGGYAGANPLEDEFFKRMRSTPLKNAVLAAFGSTRKPGGEPETDNALQALLKTETSVTTIVGKASSFQVQSILETSLEENLLMVGSSVKYLKQKGRRVFFDAEHFFDGYTEKPEYALDVLKAAFRAGAERIVLCDTNGGTLTHDIQKIVKTVTETLPKDAILGIHTHNDSDVAVACAIAAFREGATQIQGCINGYGERTGNANLISIIADLQVKMGIRCIKDELLVSLTSLSKFVAETVNMRPSPFQPYVGSSAFSHKGGLHASAIEKTAVSYQHVPPELVGNRNSVTISDLSGRGNVKRRLRELGMEEEFDQSDTTRIVRLLKSKEAQGFAYENASASFELLLQRETLNYERPFEIVDFKVLMQASGNSEATIKVRVNNETLHTAAEGDGPVSALNNAMRKALTQFYPELKRVRLTDYKVRVVNERAGADARVRVTIESGDGEGNIWITVGASENIITASWLALADSLEWWLCRNPQKVSFTEGSTQIQGSISEGSATQTNGMPLN